jgi:DNA-binding response OmpR family regulator/signal transduction histidine kinase
MRVLVVEDHPRLAETIAKVLRREGMAVDIAFDGAEALQRARVTSYDVVVLDRDLPAVHGDDVCRALVVEGRGAVLMLTAAAGIEERVEGLGIGADDYLPKPFHLAELVARIRALARRSTRSLPPTLSYQDLMLDSSHRLVTRGGERLALSPKEFAVLELLLGAEGAVVSTEEILERAWDDATDPFTNAVRMTISRLRAKLGEPPVIETVTPVGYRHPQTTVRWRLTLLYGGLFLACGAALLAITYTLVARATTSSGPFNVAFTVRGGGTQGQVRGLPTPGKVRGGATPGQVRGGATSQLVRAVGPPILVPPQIQSALATRAGQHAIGVIIHRQRGADLNRLEVESGIALGIMAIISALLGWLVAGRVLRPLRTITATAQEISEASLHRRLALSGPRDELRQLADTIDALLARLEGAFDAQRRFVANASHELRTPLTAARALLEMVLTDRHATVGTFRETCQQVLKENEYQEELIDALLTLAQGQRGLDRRELVDLSQVVHAVVDARGLDAAANGVRITASIAPVAIMGDARLVERLVSNLVENAIRHNTLDGEVDVSVRAHGNAAVLGIANTGPSIPDAEVSRLLQPFQRLSRDRTGHGDGLGLGLSIVAAIARAHDAQLDVRPREEGGLVVRVLFPLELVLEDLAESVAGERVHELHPAGALERGESLRGELE